MAVVGGHGECQATHCQWAEAHLCLQRCAGLAQPDVAALLLLVLLLLSNAVQVWFLASCVRHMSVTTEVARALTMVRTL